VRRRRRPGYGKSKPTDERHHPQEFVAHQRCPIFELDERQLFSSEVPLGIAASRPAIGVAGGRRQIEVRRDAVYHEIGIRPDRELVTAIR